MHLFHVRFHNSSSELNEQLGWSFSNDSDHKVVVGYSGLYKKYDVEYVNVYSIVSISDS